MGNQTRRHFIGGSDARIIMGGDEQALIRLWRQKRGEVEPEDLSLVRGLYRAADRRRSEESEASDAALDGRHFGWSH
jgi:predicted phage-related endonuclease